MRVIAAALDDQQHGAAAKLSTPDPWMLAAYVFDLTRRTNYIYKALRGFFDPPMKVERPDDDSFCTDPQAIAKEILAHNVRVDRVEAAAPGDPPNWQARARELEKIIREQSVEVGRDHWRVLHYAAGEDWRDPVPPPADVPGKWDRSLLP
jgi:hypothetical protein